MLSSCVDLHKSEYNKIVNQWVGKNIKLPLINKNEYIGKYKIITRINGSCYSCIYQLKDWKLFIDEVKEKYSIPFYYIWLQMIRQHLIQLIKEKYILIIL